VGEEEGPKKNMSGEIGKRWLMWCNAEGLDKNKIADVTQ
jgi:hypothetical protein